MNIIFDLGGVVFDWQPDKIIKRFYQDKETQKLIKETLFNHPDWLALDRGTLSFEDAVERTSVRCGRPQQEISDLLSAVPESLTPLPDSVALLQMLGKTENKLYVLSNMHKASIEYLDKHNDFWGLFRGRVISCYIHKIKPELEIYQHLLNEFELEPSETVFIDDMAVNTTAAASLGIQTIQFHTAAQCKETLIELGCIEA